MDQERREQLRELIRTEPHVRNVLEPLLNELASTQAHCDALKSKVEELNARLDEIEAAKTEVASSAPKAKAKTKPTDHAG